MSRKKKIYDLTMHAAIKVFKKPLFSIMKYMAATGYTSGSAYRQGFLPVSTHFYHPIPDINDLENSKIWEKVRPLPGAGHNLNQYSQEYTTITTPYSAECSWPVNSTGDLSQFFINNGTFTFGCASTLHCYIRHLKPRTIIEIGSGNSSRVINSALRLNSCRDGRNSEYIVVDPYSSVDPSILAECTEIERKKVQDLTLDFFGKLGSGDILFIDSSHACKAGSDVNFLILEVLPLLKSGVYIHFHDIPMPFEYDRKYFVSDDFRVFWTESYLLEAFLLFNREFRIAMPMAFMQAYNMDLLLKQFPQAKGLDFGFCSGSFWIQRIEGS